MQNKEQIRLFKIDFEAHTPAGNQNAKSRCLDIENN